MRVRERDVEGTVGARFMLTRSAEAFAAYIRWAMMVLAFCIKSTRAQGGVRATTLD